MEDPTPTPVAGPVGSFDGPPPPKPGKSSSKRVLKVIGWTILGCLGAATLYAVFVFLTLSSNCDKKANAITALNNQLQGRLQAVRINGKSLTSLHSDANTDCVDGADTVTVSATYSLAASNMAAAKATLDQALGGTDDNYTASEKPADNFTLMGLETNIITPGGTTYPVIYNFSQPITCMLNGERSGCNLDTVITDYGLLNKPIESVSISLSGTTHY